MLLMSKEDDDGKHSCLDISQHPGWPKMEESLGLVMLKKMEDARITSFLHSASVEDMSRTMNRYIYLALVHASGVHVSLLEQTVEVLEAEKEELRVKIKTLAEEKAEEEMAMAVAGKDNDEALERASRRIAELERQLHDKKAFGQPALGGRQHRRAPQDLRPEGRHSGQGQGDGGRTGKLASSN